MIDEIIFKRALPEDAERLSVISVAAKRYWDYPEAWIQKWMPELLISSAYIEQHQLMKAVYQEEIIGFCVVEKDEEKYEIAHLWVLPTCIGKGIGKRLLAISIDAFIPKESRIMVLADPNAEAFYQKQGFETTSQFESYPPGRFLPIMWGQA